MTASHLSTRSPRYTPEELRFLEAAVAELKRRDIWRPLPGPQTMAYESKADVVGFGGAAGGGKTDLACGKALTQHSVIQIFRREGTELNAIIERMVEIVGHRRGLGGRPPVWRAPSERAKLIEFGSVPNLGDEIKFQGRAKDLLIIDEAANFLESQVRFLMGWVRTTDPKQRTQTLLTFNPPTSAAGRWVVSFFAPWLDSKHPCPAQPGELRYFATIGGKDMEVADGRPFIMRGAYPEYSFDPEEYPATEIIYPKSRTFIPSRISDNPYLLHTGYMSQLQALPEPLRSQMLHGDFEAGTEDDPWQVIPTAWVDAAMDRWKPKEVKPTMDSIGCDVARGGADQTVIARRHAMWFDVPLAYQGSQTPDGPKVASLVIAASRDKAPQHIDVIGVGASPYDFLLQANQPVIGVNVAERATGTDKSGRLFFANQRSELWWRMREALDPDANNGIQLPPDSRLRADLCAPKWRLANAAIQVESREEISKRIGRSPDYASAYILALIHTPRVQDVARKSYTDYDPYAAFSAQTKSSYDPYAKR